MIDLMLDCIKKGEKTDDNAAEEDSSQYDLDMKLDHEKLKHGKITEEDVVATALIFLTAGYDTTGMTLSFLAYEMSQPTLFCYGMLWSMA
jgi:cytochrome P450